MTITLLVDGMHCGACAKRITQAVQRIAPGVRVDVDIPKGTVDVAGIADRDAIARAIEDAGFAPRAAA